MNKIVDIYKRKLYKIKRIVGHLNMSNKIIIADLFSLMLANSQIKQSKVSIRILPLVIYTI